MQSRYRVGVTKPTVVTQDVIPIVDGMATARGYEMEPLIDGVGDVGCHPEVVRTEPTKGEGNGEVVPLSQEHYDRDHRDETLKQGTPEYAGHIPERPEEIVTQFVDPQIDTVENALILRASKVTNPPRFHPQSSSERARMNLWNDVDLSRE
jgi:hypothetical protein